jgi:hypothetical protein
MKAKFKLGLKKILTLFFSILLSTVYIIGTNVKYTSLFGKIDAVYIEKIDAKEILMIVLLSFVIYFIILIITKLYENKLESVLFSKKKVSKQSLKVSIIKWLGYFIIINLFWLPYYLAYYPGNVFSDGITSINQALFTGIDNHHTLLYSYYISIFAHLGDKINNFNFAICLYTLIQSCVMVGILSYFMLWLSKYNINNIYKIICLLFICLFPLYPLYATTMWKDTFFSLLLFLYILMLVDFCTQKKDINKNITLVNFIIISFFVCFLRNNGIYIVIFTLVFFIIFYFKKLKMYKKFLIYNTTFIVITIVIQGPIYTKLNLKEEFVESIAIPMQQIGAVVSYNGNYNQNYISKIWNINEIKDKYTPAIADTMKWYMENFDETYLNNSKSQFLKYWVEIVIRNPKISVDAFLLENLGFWHLTYQDGFSYVQIGVWNNFYGIERRDILYQKTGIELDKYVIPKKYISSGLLFWLAMISAFLCFRINNIKKLLPYAPIIGLWLTIMIATPVAFSLRYVYILVLFIPLLIPLPGILKQCNENIDN